MSQVLHTISAKLPRLIVLVVAIAFPFWPAQPSLRPPRHWPPWRVSRTGRRPKRREVSYLYARFCRPGTATFFVYAHGYVPASAPRRHPGGTTSTCRTALTSPTQPNFLGYTFATTTYSVNGLAIKQGLADLVDLVDIFRGVSPDAQTRHPCGCVGGWADHHPVHRAVSECVQWGAGGLWADRGLSGADQLRGRFSSGFRLLLSRLDPRDSRSKIPPALIATWSSYYTTTVVPVLLAPSSAISVTQLHEFHGRAL